MSSNLLRSFVCLTAACFAANGSSASAALITLNSNRDLSVHATAFVQGGQQLNDANLGNSIVLQVGTAGGGGTANEVRSLVSFDESLIPAYGSINSVTLRMYFRSTDSFITGATPFGVQVHAISAANADWVEGTGTGSGGPADNIGSTWNRKNEVGLINWAGGTGSTLTGGLRTAGVDYQVTNLASYNFNALPADGTPIDFVFSGSSAQLTNLINSWDSANGGFLMFHNNVATLGGNVRVFFYSAENANPLLQPQLLVDYSLPPAPEPSSIVLLGLGMLLLAKRRRR